MTYPQPDSVQPVLTGQEFFRLKTLVGIGDIYESEVSALGFALGPDSDIANVLITYFDNNQAQKVSQAVISPDRNLVGRIDARNDVAYPGSTPRKGRILLSSKDIYDTRWRPSGFDANDRIEFETPILDVVQYFVNAPSVAPPRSDRIFRYQYFEQPGAAGNSSWIVVPAFGRKSGYMTFLNLDGLNTVTVFVYGVKMGISGPPGPDSIFQLQLNTQAILSGGSHVFKYLSSASGLWDAFAIELRNYDVAAMPTTVTLSDDVL